jgi:hypothetical protein
MRNMAANPSLSAAVQHPRIARRNNQNRAYQVPNELSHDPPLFDGNYRWTSDPQRAAIVKCASISPLPWTPSMDQKIMCATHD